MLALIILTALTAIWFAVAHIAEDRAPRRSPVRIRSHSGPARRRRGPGA